MLKLIQCFMDFSVSTVRMKVELDPHIFLSDWLMMLILHIISINWHFTI